MREWIRAVERIEGPWRATRSTARVLPAMERVKVRVLGLLRLQSSSLRRLWSGRRRGAEATGGSREVGGIDDGDVRSEDLAPAVGGGGGSVAGGSVAEDGMGRGQQAMVGRKEKARDRDMWHTVGTHERGWDTWLVLDVVRSTGLA